MPTFPADNNNVHNRTLSSSSSVSVTRAMKDVSGIDRDLKTLSKFVQGKLFVHVIHDLKGGDKKNDDMSDQGRLFKQFAKFFKSLENRHKIKNKHIQGANDENLDAYLQHIWNKGSIPKYLAAEKSNDLPIPAYETFEHKTTLPRRYFFFFDTFVQAGRHNKEAWTKGTNAVEKWGEQVIPGTNPPEIAKTIEFHRFGTCALEAHVLTTIQENYFLWIFQCLTSTAIVKPSWDDKVNHFKTEYDIDWVAAQSRLGPSDILCGSDTPGALNAVPERIALKYSGPAEYEDDANTSSEEDDDDESPSSSTSDTRKVPDAPVFSIVEKKNNLIGYTRARRQEFTAFKQILGKCTVQQHQRKLAWMREWIPKVRGCSGDEEENVTEEQVLQAVAASKYILKQLTDIYEDPIKAFDDGKFEKGREKERPKKRRKMDANKTKQSDAKLARFMKKKEELDRKEQSGITLAAERLYKELKKDHMAAAVEDDELQPVVMKSDKLMNQLMHVGLC
eukprot:scaffold1076_cov81-Cylindrotheca_fusiformis.AAC.3